MNGFIDAAILWYIFLAKVTEITIVLTYSILWNTRTWSRGQKQPGRLGVLFF